eukprot:scaffold391781_cov43-Prasinocladus_malaysianus.AAC.1
MAFRTACSPVEPDSTHLIVTIYCTRRDLNSTASEPQTSSMHLVNLAATETFNAQMIDRKEAAAAETSLKSLSK